MKLTHSKECWPSPIGMFANLIEWLASAVALRSIGSSIHGYANTRCYLIINKIIISIECWLVAVDVVNWFDVIFRRNGGHCLIFYDLRQMK